MAAASSHISSSPLVLDDAAEVDDAISKPFFGDDGGVLSWPASSAVASTLTSQESVDALCGKHGVPSDLIRVCADDHLGLRACSPQPVDSTRMCVYAAALDAGLRLPLHDFYARVLRRYRLAPSQLTPNAWTYLAAFVLLCEDAGVEPLVSAFRYFFTICAHRQHGKPTGWHHFQPYYDGSRRLFAGALPSWSGWRSRYFFLDCPSGWKCPVNWGKPKREDVRRVQHTDSVIEKLKKKIGCVDVKDFLANREMPVGDQAALAQLHSTLLKRRRLSPPVVLPQPPLPASPSPPLGLAPIIASSTGGGCIVAPPAPGLGSATSSAFQSFGVSSRTSVSRGLLAATTPPHPHFFAGSTPAPRDLPDMVCARGSSEVAPPAMMCASDAVQLWEAIANAREQATMIVKLNQEIHLLKAWNAQQQNEMSAAGAKHAELMAHLDAANDRSSYLNEQLVRLDKQCVAERGQFIDHLRTASVEVAQLKAENAQLAAEKAQLKEEVAAEKAQKEELAAEKAQLKEELAADNARLKEDFDADKQHIKRQYFAMGVREMVDFILTLYGNVVNVNAEVLKADAETLLKIEDGGCSYAGNIGEE